MQGRDGRGRDNLGGISLIVGGEHGIQQGTHYSVCHALILLMPYQLWNYQLLCLAS